MREVYLLFDRKSYFEESFGYDCLADGPVAGALGVDIEAQLFLRLRRPKLWPIHEKILEYSEDELFDVVEFLYDCVSMPISEDMISCHRCGGHYSRFDPHRAREEFREEINRCLSDYGQGWELTRDGEIVALPDEGMAPLLSAELPPYDPDNVERRIEAAIRKYRQRGATVADRRDAVRDLADVLEYLRPKASECLLTKKDESDLFQIANAFAVRHHDGRQKGDYDIRIWYSWMFYVYLATVHAAVRVAKGHEEARLAQ